MATRSRFDLAPIEVVPLAGSSMSGRAQLQHAAVFSVNTGMAGLEELRDPLAFRVPVDAVTLDLHDRAGPHRHA